MPSEGAWFEFTMNDAHYFEQLWNAAKGENEPSFDQVRARGRLIAGAESKSELEQQSVDDGAATHAHKRKQLQEKLQTQRLSALQRHAAAEGVDEDSLADAIDADDPKAEIIQLILAKQPAASDQVQRSLAYWHTLNYSTKPKLRTSSTPECEPEPEFEA
eukprot:COSAG01_NODE_5980_length_3919_cov_9.290314_3_plen_160_part_00